MLDGVIDYLPSPLDVPAIKGVNPETDEEVIRKSDDNAPFAALAFKVMTDPYVGKLTFFRVYSGTLQSGSYVLNSTKEQAGTDWTYSTNARQSPRRNLRSLCRGYCCCSRFKGYSNRRYSM